MAARDLIFTVLGIDRASHVFNDVGQSMDRMSKTGTKSMAALLASSLGASAGIAAALAGVGVVFTATAAAALSQNAEVASSFRDLGQSLKTGLAADAGVLENEMVGAAQDINSAFQELRPELREAFSAAQPYVDNLTDGVTGFARTAMPGMVTAVKSAGPVMDGLESLLIDAGHATGDFLETVSAGAPEAGAGLQSLGDLLEGVLPNIGEMLVNLTGLWAEHGDQAVRVITGITDVASDLSDSALPTLSDGLGVALDVLEGLLNVVEPMSGILGPLIGMWLSLSLAMKGFGAVRGVVDSVGNSVGGLRDKFAKSDGAVGKLTTTVGGAMGLLGGPWGLAVAGATTVLALFGQESQENAADQRTLSGALKESGGSFDEHARQVLLDSEAYQEVAGSIEEAGISQRDYLDAVIKGGKSLTDLEDQLRGIVEAGSEMTTAGKGGQTAALTDQAEAAKSALGSLKGLREIVVGAEEDFRRNAEAVGGVASSMAGAKPGADSLAEAIGVLGDKTADTADRADALNTAWQRLLGIHITLEEATSNFEGGLDNIANHLDKVKKETENWSSVLLTADGQVNLSTEQGRQLSGMLIAAGEDYRSLAQAAYDSSLQRGESEAQATAAATAAAQQRRDQFIAEATQMFGNAEVAQMLADRYFGLPDDVMTLIKADASNAEGVVDAFINKPRSLYIDVRTNLKNSGLTGERLNKAMKMFARGGHTDGTEPILVGEEGAEIFWPDGPGTISSHQQSSRYMASLRASAADSARSGPPMGEAGGAAVGEAMRAMAAAGWLGGGPATLAVEWGGGPSDELGAAFWEWLRNRVTVRYRGDVQRALGR